LLAFHLDDPGGQGARIGPAPRHDPKDR
jgi:hypothetical protein